MPDHYHYEYADQRHSHSGEYAADNHDHYYDYAERHHSHDDLAARIDGLRADLNALAEQVYDMTHSHA